MMHVTAVKVKAEDVPLPWEVVKSVRGISYTAWLIRMTRRRAAAAVVAKVVAPEVVDPSHEIVSLVVMSMTLHSMIKDVATITRMCN